MKSLKEQNEELEKVIENTDEILGNTEDELEHWFKKEDEE